MDMRDTTSRYFDEVSRLALPTVLEERANFADYCEKSRQLERATDPSKRATLTRERARRGQRIAEGYLRFVIGKARDRTRDEDLLNDYISAGNEGLMTAIPKFDPKYGVRFLTYAAPWVRVKMDEVQHRLGTVHVSVHQRKRSVQRGEGPPDPIMTPVEDVQLADTTDVERDATPEGRVALSFLHAAGLTRCEKVVLVLGLGLRGDPQTDDELSLTLFAMDGSVFPLEDLRALREGAIGKLQGWARANPEVGVRAELT